MKKILLVSLIAAIITACSPESQLVTPKVLNGNGVFKGKVALINFERDSTWSNDGIVPKRHYTFENTLVEIVGTNISAISDSAGIYILSGLDSGNYSIRFTHQNYDTVVINDIKHNGLDSITVKWSEYDRTGYLHSDSTVYLMQEQPFVSVENIDTYLTQKIIEYKYPNGNVYDRDTMHYGSAKFKLKVNSTDEGIKKILAARFTARVTNTPTLNMNEIPSSNEVIDKDLKYTNMGYIFMSKILLDSNDYSKRNCSLDNEMMSFDSYSKQYLKSVNIKEMPQLFLHIIPIWRCLNRDWILTGQHDRGGKYAYPQEQFRYESVYTIPIEWKE